MMRLRWHRAAPTEAHKSVHFETRSVRSGEAAVEFQDAGKSGELSGISGVQGKLDIRPTALPQLHQLGLTAHVLEAPNAALHSLVTSQ